MTLLDRFRTPQPRQKHADPAVRLAFVQEIPVDDRQLLAEIAQDDSDARVRRAAVAKLMDPLALARVAAADASIDVRAQALAMLRDIALDAFEGVAEADSMAAVEALLDAKTLAAVAKASLREEVALRALGRVSEPRALGSIARHAQLEPIRLAALAALQDKGEVLNVAMNSEFKDAAQSAVERLDERTELEQVASKGKNKSAVKRARGILREMDEREAAEAAATKPAPLDSTKPVLEVPAPSAEELEAAREAADAVRREEAARLEAEAAREAEASRQREEAQALERQQAADEAERQRVRLEEQAARDREREAARVEAEAQDERKRQEALTRLTQLAGRVETLAASADLTIKAGERALRDIRAVLDNMPPLPSKQQRDAVVHRLETAQGLIVPRVHEMHELADWRRWANLGVQEQLCVKMEGLSAVEDPAEIAKQVRELQEQWRQASDVPRPQGEALWRRFKVAHDLAWARCQAHFAAENEARGESLAKKLALCERAEALADSTQWIQTAEEIKKLQAEWQSIGPVPRGQEKATWQRFRTACDRFFTRRQADLAERKQVWVVNLAKKEALCAEVEALADSTDWDSTAATIKRLQNEWKLVGPVKKSRSEAIWQRFRGACDRFFARYAQRHDVAKAERVAAREAICVELEELASSPDAAGQPAELLGKLRALRGRWQHEIDARGVEREQAAQLDQRFAAAFGRVIAASPAAFAGTDLDPDANRKRMEALVHRIEALAQSLASPAKGAADASLSPTDRLAAMLKEALAANTIGGKADDDSRLRAALDEVRQAQASWARIGSVSNDVRRGLSDRFARACRQITERAGQVAAVGKPSGGSGRSGGPAPSGRPGRGR